MTRTTIALRALAASAAAGGAGAGGPCPAQPAGPETPSPHSASLDPPAAAGASAYRLVPAGEGLILSWLEVGDRGVRLMWSRLNDSGWSGPGVVLEQRAGLVANWADLPAVVEGGDGALYAHWLRQSGPGGASYDIVMHRSNDGGATWRELGKLNDDEVRGEHGFVSYVPLPGGLRAFWLDGRETSGHGHSGLRAGSMTLRTALVGDTIGVSELLDEAVCDCCNTAAAMTPDGPIIAYRDREQGEIRDISVAGEGVGAVHAVHDDGWAMPGCPVNGPAMAAAGGRVAVAWFTGSPEARVNVAFSDDGGKTFGDAAVMDEVGDASAPLGRVDVVLDGDEAIVCWLRTERREGVLLAQRVDRAGPVGEPVRVAPMDGSRPSGFPQMETLGERVIIIWREIEAERLRSVELQRRSIGG